MILLGDVHPTSDRYVTSERFGAVAPDLSAADAELLDGHREVIDKELAAARAELAGPIAEAMARAKDSRAPEPESFIGEMGYVVAEVESIHVGRGASPSGVVQRPKEAGSARIRNLGRGGRFERLTFESQLRDQWRELKVRRGHLVLIMRGVDKGTSTTWRLKVIGGQPAAIPPKHRPIERPSPRPADLEFARGLALHLQREGWRPARSAEGGELVVGTNGCAVVMALAYVGADAEGERWEMYEPGGFQQAGLWTCMPAVVEVHDLLADRPAVVQLSAKDGEAFRAAGRAALVGTVLMLRRGRDGLVVEPRTSEHELQSRLALLEHQVAAGGAPPAHAGPLPGTRPDPWQPAASVEP